MTIIAFILLIISLSKLCLLGSATLPELRDLFRGNDFSIIKLIVILVYLDSFLGVMCSLYILL